MREALWVALAAVTALALATLALPSGSGDAGSGPPVVATSGEEDEREDHPPIRIHGDEQFRLPTSGVTGGNGTADDPYVIEGWTIRPEYLTWDFAGNEPRDDDLVAKYCKPARIADAEILGATARLHGIEIADTSAHLVIRNLSIEPREPFLGPADRGRWDSSVTIGLLLLDADNVTIRNVTVGDGEIESIHRGICARGSDHLAIRETTIQQTAGPGVEIQNGQAPVLENNTLRQTRQVAIALEGTEAPLVANNSLANGGGRGLRIDSASEIVIRDNRVRDFGATGIAAIARYEDWSQRVEVLDNTVKRTGGAGLAVVYAHPGIIARNVLEENDGTSALDVDPRTGKGAHIHDNRIVNNSAAWAVRLESHPITFVDNVVRDNDNDGIRVVDGRSRTEIRHNNISDNGRMGVALTERTCCMAIEKNEIRNNQHGVAALNCKYCGDLVWDISARLNNFVGNDGHAVRMGTEGTDQWNATDAWWGCPDGPDLPGDPDDPDCDSIDNVVEGGSDSVGILYDPWSTEPVADAGPR